MSQSSGMGGESAGGSSSGQLPTSSTAPLHPPKSPTPDLCQRPRENMHEPSSYEDLTFAHRVIETIRAYGAAQKEAKQRQLGKKRDYPGNPKLH